MVVGTSAGDARDSGEGTARRRRVSGHRLHQRVDRALHGGEEGACSGEDECLNRVGRGQHPLMLGG